MKHHHLFDILGIFILLFAVVLSFTIGSIYALPFYAFALAAGLRAISLKADQVLFRSISYVIFALGLVLLVYTATA